MRIATIALIALALIAGCSGGLTPQNASTVPEPPTSSDTLASATSPAAPAQVEVALTDEMRFEPAHMVVPVGVPVTFILTNNGAIDHEFFIGDEQEQEHHEEEMMDSMGSMGHDEPGGVTVASGQTQELTYTFEQSGQTLAGCHIAGHYDEGMKATITVAS